MTPTAIEAIADAIDKAFQVRGSTKDSMAQAAYDAAKPYIERELLKKLREEIYSWDERPTDLLLSFDGFARDLGYGNI